MADTKIGIDVQASTSAAKAQLSELSRETRTFVEAGDAANKSQKSLGREISETKARQLEAAEALRRVKSAQHEHNLTMDAFGPKSAQAKASLQALTLAQQESRRAADQANKALENVAAKATAAAKAEDGQLTPATRRLADQLQHMGREADKSAAELRRMDLAAVAASKGTGQLSKGISALTVASGALIAGGVAHAIQGIGEAMAFTLKSSIDFEASMTRVSKVLDDKSAANVARVDQGIKDLAVSIGVVPGEIAEMTAALAASGLQDDLLGYTEDAAKIGVAFDLTGEQAGHAMASLSASLKLPRDELNSIFGSMNQLDDAMNSSAKQLVEYLEGVAGIGKAASISGQTMLALGSAIISTGTAPDKAATGVKNFIATMEAGSAATDAQVGAFKKLGFEAEAVARQMATGKAEEQIKKIADAIGKLPPEERFSTLIDLFGRESIGSVGGLATNVDLLGQAFAVAGDKAAAAGSVQAEFNRVSQTTGHQLEVLKANAAVAALAIGDELLPEIGSMATAASAWVKENKALIAENVVGFIHGLRDAVKGVTPYVVGAGKVLGVMVDMFGGVERAVGPVIVGLGALRVASTLALGPWGVLAAGIVAGAVAISDAMEDAEKRSMSMIRTAMRIRDKGLTGAGIDGASPQELLRMREEITLLEKKNSVIQGDVRGLSPATIKKMEAERQADVVALRERAKMIDGALATKTAELEIAVKVGKEARAQAEAEKDRMDRLKLELGYLNSLDSLSTAQAKRKKALEGVGVEGVGVEPKKKKGGAGRAKKDPNAFAADLMSFDSELAVYQAKLAKDIRAQDLADQEAKQAELEAIFEREVALHAGKVSRYDQEIELLQARHSMETEQVDAVFFTLSVESQAEVERQRLLDERMKREMQYARWAVQNAKNSKQREEAQTNLEGVQHKKRVADAAKAHAAEQAQQARRAQVFDGVRTHVLGVGEAVVAGIKAQQEGEKGAIAALTGEYLKGVAIRMAIKGAEETVLGVSALAGIVTAGLAPAHFTAAGMAFAAAAAAGGGAAIAGGVAKAQGYGAKKDDDGAGVTPGSSGGSGSGGISRPSGGSTGGGDDDGIPTSYVQGKGFMRNQPTTAAKETAGTVINYNFPSATVLGGTQEQVGIALDRLTANARRSAGRTR